MLTHNEKIQIWENLEFAGKFVPMTPYGTQDVVFSYGEADDTLQNFKDIDTANLCDENCNCDIPRNSDFLVSTGIELSEITWLINKEYLDKGGFYKFLAHEYIYECVSFIIDYLENEKTESSQKLANEWNERTYNIKDMDSQQLISFINDIDIFDDVVNGEILENIDKTIYYGYYFHRVNGVMKVYMAWTNEYQTLGSEFLGTAEILDSSEQFQQEFTSCCD